MADTKVRITCPACDCEMHKIVDPETNTCIDICLDGCGGIFFDNRELEKFDETPENADEIFKAIEGKSFKPVETDEVRICPICEVSMVKMGSGIEGVEIDVCNVCGGKFLDNGELEKIRNGVKSDITRYEATLETLCDKFYSAAKPSPRRQYFEDLVKRIITR